MYSICLFAIDGGKRKRCTPSAKNYAAEFDNCRIAERYITRVQWLLGSGRAVCMIAALPPPGKYESKRGFSQRLLYSSNFMLLVCEQNKEIDLYTLLCRCLALPSIPFTHYTHQPPCPLTCARPPLSCVSHLLLKPWTTSLGKQWLWPSARWRSSKHRSCQT